jgi:PhnB protein
MTAKPIPDGYHSLTPYLYVKSSLTAMAFYAQAFGATEVMRLPMPDGGIAHAEIQIGDSIVMLADENPEWGNRGPLTLGGTCVGFCLYVEDCDTVFERALAAGATVKRPLADQFYGDRTGTVVDPFGYQWTVATHKEDLTQDEVQQRMKAMMSA